MKEHFLHTSIVHFFSKLYDIIGTSTLFMFDKLRQVQTLPFSAHSFIYVLYSSRDTMKMYV